MQLPLCGVTPLAGHDPRRLVRGLSATRLNTVT